MKLHTALLVLTTPLAFALTSCKQQPTTKDIIAPKPVTKAPTKPTKMQAYSHQETVNWLGETYTLQIRRTPLTANDTMTDDSGNKYYDNSISVKILRKDGSVFYENTFVKADFASYIEQDYLKESVLLGIVLEKAEGSYLQLAASVGAPDALSDEYVPLILQLSRMGQLTITKDSRIDSSESDEEDDKVY